MRAAAFHSPRKRSESLRYSLRTFIKDAITVDTRVSASPPDPLLTLRGDGNSSPARPVHLDCVKASEQCLREPTCSTRYRTMRQCVAGRESNFSAVPGPEAQGECRSAIEAMKQSPLYSCRCRRGMKKEKNCLRIFWSIFQSLQGMCRLRELVQSIAIQ